MEVSSFSQGFLLRATIFWGSVFVQPSALMSSLVNQGEPTTHGPLGVSPPVLAARSPTLQRYAAVRKTEPPAKSNCVFFLVGALILI